MILVPMGKLQGRETFAGPYPPGLGPLGTGWVTEVISPGENRGKADVSENLFFEGEGWKFGSKNSFSDKKAGMDVAKYNGGEHFEKGSK